MVAFSSNSKLASAWGSLVNYKSDMQQKILETITVLSGWLIFLIVSRFSKIFCHNTIHFSTLHQKKSFKKSKRVSDLQSWALLILLTLPQRCVTREWLTHRLEIHNVIYIVGKLTFSWFRIYNQFLQWASLRISAPKFG